MRIRSSLDPLFVTQDGRIETVTLTTNPLHQVIARRRQIGGATELTTYSWTPDGALQASQGPGGATTLVHDWRDRLVEVQSPGGLTAELVLDPLGRLVARRTTTPAGTLHRAYLHDGDQVVEEHASVPGHTGVLLARRHHWGRWIDDLVAEQIDTDGDGTLETTLYPITDLLGSVELLTDEEGRIIERITYDPDGTPHFWGEDTVRPRVTQLAWTGNGASPTGVTVAATTLVVRFSEAIHDATMAGLILTLTPDPGSRSEALDDDGRTLRVSFEQPIPSTTPTTFHLDGLRDRTGNAIFPFDTTFTLTDSQAYAVLADTSAPSITAIIDTAAGLVLSFDEPVQPLNGTPLQGAIMITRSGLPVDGTTTRLTETALAWTPTEPASWQPGGEYRLTALTLQDLHSQPSPVQTAPLPLTITHLATQPTDALLAYTAPTDSAPLAASAYGQTALFQGREWHADLGTLYYRNRWLGPGFGMFEPDPAGYHDSPSTYQALGWAPPTVADPLGLWIIVARVESVTLPLFDGPAMRVRIYNNSALNVGGPFYGIARGQQSTFIVVDPHTGRKQRRTLRFPPAHGTAEHRALGLGDTPFGLFLGTDPANGHGLITPRNNRAYGPYSINFHPVGMEGGADMSRRDTLRFHGGSNTEIVARSGVSALAPLQTVTMGPEAQGFTQGCGRFFNRDIVSMVTILRGRVAAGESESGIVVIGDRDYLVTLANRLRQMRPDLRWSQYHILAEHPVFRESGASVSSLWSAIVANMEEGFLQ